MSSPFQAASLTWRHCRLVVRLIAAVGVETDEWRFAAILNEDSGDRGSKIMRIYSFTFPGFRQAAR
jgi:hypothetical protein